MYIHTCRFTSTFLYLAKICYPAHRIWVFHARYRQKLIGILNIFLCGPWGGGFFFLSALACNVKVIRCHAFRRLGYIMRVTRSPEIVWCQPDKSHSLESGWIPPMDHNWIIWLTSEPSRMSAYDYGLHVLLNKILLYPRHRDIGYPINKVLQGGWRAFATLDTTSTSSSRAPPSDSDYRRRNPKQSASPEGSVRRNPRLSACLE